MTAIIGFNCVDGVVLAADTEEVYGESHDKAYAHKLFPVERDTANLCVAGAGPGYLIDYAKDQIVNVLETCKDNLEAKDELSKVLNSLYSGEFKNYPSENIAIQLLVGVQLRSHSERSKWGESTLFECESNLVTQVPLGRGRILGSGELLKETVNQFAGWGLTASLADWVSTYVTFEAKRRYGGIGGRTHTCTIWNDGRKMVYPMGRDVQDKEAVLEGLPKVMRLLMLSLEPSVNDSRAGDLFEAVKIWRSKARKELKNIQQGRHKKKSDFIQIPSREFEKFIKHMNAATQSVSRKSEPEQ
jgi:hypothetical protein